MTSPHDIDKALADASFDGIVAALRYAATALDGAATLADLEAEKTGNRYAEVRHTSRRGELDMIAKLLIESAPDEPRQGSPPAKEAL